MNREGEGNRDFMLAGAMLLLACWLALLVYPFANGQSYNSTAVLNTTVNITNSAPMVGPVDIPPSINLIGYANTTVLCNVSVTDYDNNTAGVNATFYYFTSSADSPDDQNHHYTNTTCTPSSPIDITMGYSCAFQVNFFANNGTWYCDAIAIDDEGAVGTNVSQSSTINPLIAISVPGILDFGNLAFGDTSDDKLANITNAGNRKIDLSVKGWGSVEGDGIAFDCEAGQIPLNQLRYDISSGSAWSGMDPITGISALIGGLSIDQRTDEAVDDYSTNTTYWKLRIPPGAGGVCNGKILFTATDGGN